MDICVTNFIEENCERLFKYAMKKSGWDKDLSVEAVSNTFIKANRPDIICKIYNEWWAYNRIKEYIKARRIKVRKEKDILVFIDWIDEKGDVSDFEKEFITRDYLDFILDEIVSFIRKRYPQAQAKYSHYFDICCYQKISGDSWDDVQKKFRKANVKEVQSRCAEILKEFKKYYSRKKKKWN